MCLLFDPYSFSQKSMTALYFFQFFVYFVLRFCRKVSSVAFADAHQQHLRTLSGQLQKVAEGTNVRTTLIYPGAIKTELLNTVAPSETKTMVEEFYKNVGITPDSIANAVMYAISQPDDVDISDIVTRPRREG